MIETECKYYKQGHPNFCILKGKSVDYNGTIWTACSQKCQELKYSVKVRNKIFGGLIILWFLFALTEIFLELAGRKIKNLEGITLVVFFLLMIFIIIPWKSNSEPTTGCYSDGL